MKGERRISGTGDRPLPFGTTSLYVVTWECSQEKGLSRNFIRVGNAQACGLSVESEAPRLLIYLLLVLRRLLWRRSRLNSRAGRLRIRTRLPRLSRRLLLQLQLPLLHLL